MHMQYFLEFIVFRVNLEGVFIRKNLFIHHYVKGWRVIRWKGSNIKFINLKNQSVEK